MVTNLSITGRILRGLEVPVLFVGSGRGRRVLQRVLVCRSGNSFPTCILDGHLHRVTYTRCCIDTTDSPDDEHEFARNM